MARQQLQWRDRPDGQWRPHSTVEASAAAEQIGHYTTRHGEKRIFDYRIVPLDSPEAIAKPAEPIYVGNNGPGFQLN